MESWTSVHVWSDGGGSVAGELTFDGYEEYLGGLKGRIRAAQIRSALAVNRELVALYWQIGRDVLRQQRRQGWGRKVIDRLSGDLRREFPEIKGFSVRNLKYMRAFAEAYPDEGFVQQLAAQIPWFHNCAILDAVKEPAARAWYVRQTIAQGWSRSVLTHQIGVGLFERQGGAATNFAATLPPVQSDLAQQALKDSYLFDFLSLGPAARERDLEQGLLEHIRKFLLELGRGFAFVGNQYHLEVGDQDFYIDLLFYHFKLRCFVVIDLKTGSFQPEFAGKLGFYLSAVDDLLRHPDDRPTLGLILCKSSNRVIAEYTLRDARRPMGVSTYELLPEEIKRSLPSIEELETRLCLSLQEDL
ncbi:MAG: DUF1016 family protein [Aphanocapsa lilacina HA4352-LM1]|nr:DUF1016 family protein [Aphanocapsa lilacina HA4352-LM1]